MTGKSEPVWAKVVELGVFDAGARVVARAMPVDPGAPVRIELDAPDPALRDALALGVRVLCRTVPRTTRQGPVQIALGIQAVERRVGFDKWVEVWHAPASEEPEETAPDTEEPLIPSKAPERVVETRLGSGAVRRRRQPTGD